jgi:uncharacterized protein (TIGR02246 family)
MTETAEQIARAYQRQYEALWTSGDAEALAALYTGDAIFTARKIALGRTEIAGALNAMIQRGWTAVTINIRHVRETAGVVLVVSEFTAFGSGPIEGETLGGKSNHVLTEVNGAWLSAMHAIF